MEGIANRPTAMLSPQQNINVPSPFTGLQQPQEKLPPPYEEAQIAVQSLENEKVSIYHHPLFPLLAMLFEKCEQATQTSDCPTAASFDNDIKNFLIQHNRDGKPCFCGDQELDNLPQNLIVTQPLPQTHANKKILDCQKLKIIKAIQVFRIHLLELEKVNELCKDFCQRYIACLKGKMQSENLLRSPLPSSFQTPTVGCVTQSFQQLPSAQPQQTFLQQPTQLLQPQEVTYYTTNPCSVAMATPPNVSVIASPLQQQATPISYNPQQPATIVVTAAPVSGQTLVLTQVPQQQQLVVNPTNIITYACSTPTNTLTVTPSTPTSSTSAGSPTEIALPTALPMPALDSPTDTHDLGKKTKRGVLPKQATQIMKTWLFSHLMHPYPTEDEKRTIASQTNLTILQVNNWFINARRRILQPMLDAGNPDSHKAKKSKIQTRPAQRFWPETLVPTQYGSPVPIIPNNLGAQGQRMPNTVQMQTLPAGSVQVPITVAMPTLLNSSGTVTLPPGTVALPPSIALQQGGNIVIVTLPANASTISTSTDVMSSTSAQSAVTTTVSSNSDSVHRGGMSPMVVGIQQRSPTLQVSQNSPLPTMAQNGNMVNIGSPHQIITTASGINPVDSLVHSLALENPDG